MSSSEMELGVRETEGMSLEDKEECGHHEAVLQSTGKPAQSSVAVWWEASLGEHGYRRM